MKICMIICGIVLIIASLGYTARMLWITPRHENFTKKAMTRYIVFGSIGTIGGVLLIVFPCLINLSKQS